MDLSTRYLGLSLAHPLVAGASPMVDDLDTVRRLEDAGAAALVMHSLFEEQITREASGSLRDLELHADSHPEARSYFPDAGAFALGPEAYLEQIRRIKQAVEVPLIASLNGTTPSGWLDHARVMEIAGADALELNVYYLPTDPQESAAIVEKRTLDVIRAVKSELRIPVAVKLSPYFSSLGHFAREAEVAGADALVLFNRFLQPDIDLEDLEAVPRLELSDSSELTLRLRWLAILFPHARADLAVSGGVHSGYDALKAVAAGASAVQMVSALLIHGPERLRQVREEMVIWLESHEYVSLSQLQGSMSMAHCPDPQAFARAHYMRMLNGWRPGH